MTLSFRSNPNSGRARKVIKSLRLLRGTSPAAAPVPLVKNRKVQLQVVTDRPGRRRTNHDDEILARAEYLATFVGRAQLLVAAGDYGIQLRAAKRELRCLGAESLKPAVVANGRTARSEIGPEKAPLAKRCDQNPGRQMVPDSVQVFTAAGGGHH
jgi:hypothetical protein